MTRDQLVILQATPFCNIDCRYCYLPHRSNTARMSAEVLAAIYSQVFQSEQFRDPITFQWHAGEPLVMPRDFYQQAFALSESINRRYHRDYGHCIQTNGTLIDREWVDLFHAHGVRIGISLDGPEFIHDRERVTRAGRGTYREAMRGLRLLQDAKIPYAVIMVLTRFALDYPDAIFDFLVENQIQQVSLNIDELDGVHGSTSYDCDDAIKKYKSFMKRLLERVETAHGMINVREFAFKQLFEKVVNEQQGIRTDGNETNRPMQLLSFDYQGNYTTFSPELLGIASERYGNFVMGNVLTDSIDRISDNPVFQLVNREVQDGVDHCRRDCRYWGLCGGGVPSIKFFEHSRFDVTETLSCRIHQQTLTDAIVEHLEDRLSSPDKHSRIEFLRSQLVGLQPPQERQRFTVRLVR